MQKEVQKDDWRVTLGVYFVASLIIGGFAMILSVFVTQFLHSIDVMLDQIYVSTVIGTMIGGYLFTLYAKNND